MNKYKVLVLNQTNKPLDFSEDVKYWKEFTLKKFGVGLDIEYTFQVSELPFKMVRKVKNGKEIYRVDAEDMAPAIRKLVKEGEYDEVIFAYNNPLIGKDVRSNTPYTVVYPGTALVTLEYGKDLWKVVNHERFHALERRLWNKGIFVNDVMDETFGKAYYKDSDVYSTSGNRAETLKLFKPYWEVMFAKQGYKYFRPEEVKGLQSSLVEMLDKARGLAGVPFVIISGKRSEERNESVGGVEDSAHLRGYAVDISCPDSSSRWKMFNAFIKVGFTRIGVNKTSFHVDNDPSKPQSVVWTYYK